MQSQVLGFEVNPEVNPGWLLTKFVMIETGTSSTLGTDSNIFPILYNFCLCESYSQSYAKLPIFVYVSLQLNGLSSGVPVMLWVINTRSSETVFPTHNTFRWSSKPFRTYKSAIWVVWIISNSQTVTPLQTAVFDKSRSMGTRAHHLSVWKYSDWQFIKDRDSMCER